MRHCTYCHGTGHNRRTCPEIDKAVQRNPNGYLARERRRSESKSRRRKCKYCCEIGHNQRTCKKKKSHLETATGYLNRFRKRTEEKMREKGFCPGALVKITSKRYWDHLAQEHVDPENILFIIERIADWKQAVPGRDGECRYNLAEGKSTCGRHLHRFRLPPMNEETAVIYWEVVSGTDDPCLPDNFAEVGADRSAQWLECNFSDAGHFENWVLNSTSILEI